MDKQTAELLTIINRLLASFPGANKAESADIIDGYLIGLGLLPVRFVAQAAQEFLSGSVPDHNMAFAPSPAQLGSRARKHWHAHLDAEKRHKTAVMQIERRDHGADKDDESRARVRAKMDEAVSGLAQSMRTDEAKAVADEKRRADFGKRADDRFRPDTDRYTTAKRLGFDVGDPDAESGDWGERRAS